VKYECTIKDSISNAYHLALQPHTMGTVVAVIVWELD